MSEPLAGVTCTVEEHVATLTFTNPRQHGALTPELLRDLGRELQGLEAKRPQTRVVVLRGGEVFSSGYALDRFPEPDELALQDEIEELCQAIERSPLVVIALLRGIAVGAAHRRQGAAVGGGQQADHRVNRVVARLADRTGGRVARAAPRRTAQPGLRRGAGGVRREASPCLHGRGVT